MSRCTIIPFPHRRRGALERFAPVIAAGYGVLAILVVLYGTSTYLTAATHLNGDIQVVLGTSAED